MDLGQETRGVVLEEEKKSVELNAITARLKKRFLTDFGKIPYQQEFSVIQRTGKDFNHSIRDIMELILVYLPKKENHV